MHNSNEDWAGRKNQQLNELATVINLAGEIFRKENEGSGCLVCTVQLYSPMASSSLAGSGGA